MTIAEKIQYYEERARQEREAAEKASCPEARRAHLALAFQHDGAAARERARRLRTD